MKTEPIEALKLIENSNTKVEDHNDENFYFESEVKEAIHVAFSEGQYNPKIKQLGWEESAEYYEKFVAETSIGRYAVEERRYKDICGDTRCKYMLTFNGKFFMECMQDRHARYQAQEDFENRVKQCLEL